MNIDKLLTELWSAADKAKAFHQAETFNEIESERLISAVNKISRGTHRVFKGSKHTASSHLIQFRQAITLNNFDASIFERQLPASALLHDIESAVVELEECLEDCYSLIYPNQFPYFEAPAKWLASSKRFVAANRRNRL